jgi:hypothetical protein
MRAGFDSSFLIEYYTDRGRGLIFVPSPDETSWPPMYRLSVNACELNTPAKTSKSTHNKAENPMQIYCPKASNQFADSG